MGDAQYWGHNAILRVEPFMRVLRIAKAVRKRASGERDPQPRFCRVRTHAPGRSYEVWLASGLEGSYEETPPTLIDELKRDRRWCRASLQHMRLIFTHGFFPTHRALFVNGILSYGSALLW